MERATASRGPTRRRRWRRRWRSGAGRLSPTSRTTDGQGPIRRLEELRLGAIEKRVEADLALGRHADVVGELEALAAVHPCVSASETS